MAGFFVDYYVRRKRTDTIDKIFPDGMPSCGLTDAALLGGSDADAPASGTIYLNR
ncbi:MAG: hypothetical protein AAB457_01140 [Patescibacteria group bacterium]